MSFGGGGGSSGTLAHTHGAAANDGGPLSTTVTEFPTGTTLNDTIQIKAVIFG